jgi:hypothetical protein
MGVIQAKTVDVVFIREVDKVLGKEMPTLGIVEIDHPGTNGVHGDPILTRYDPAHLPGLSEGGTLSFHSQNPIHDIQIRDSPAIKVYKEFRQSFYVSGSGLSKLSF